VQGAVLLKNDGGVLPFDAASLKSVALIGPLANLTTAYVGSYANAGAPVVTMYDARCWTGTRTWTCGWRPGATRSCLS